MAGSDRWYFDKDFLSNTPSRKCGIDADKELSYRQQAANLIQDMGQRLHVTQLCINTAIVYMHRFYSFHSFSVFHRNSISSCALFLAAKVEEQPRKLEHVIKVSHMCLHRENPSLDIKSEAYQEQAIELVFNENLMLQTLGFDIDVEHPHTSVVNCCQLVRASKDLAQTSYFMATNSLHLTTMCLQHRPTVVACVCIHLACKWSSWEIPRSSEGKDWFYYVDKSVTLELLEQLTKEFLAILDKCPSRLKRKILSGSPGSATNVSHSSSSSIKPKIDEKKSSSHIKEESKPIPSKSSSHPTSETTTSSVNSSLTRRSPSTSPLLKKIKSEPTGQQSNKIPVPMSYAAYRERKERANTHTDDVKQSEQSIVSNNKSVNRDIVSNQSKDKSVVNESLSAKQIISDRQKQSEERNKIRAKNSDYLFDSISSRATNTTKFIPSSTHPKSQNNITNDDFYDNLMNKPSNFNSIFSNDCEDSFDFKREITSDLKMEFSDNSNQSNDGLNLTSFTSDFMNESSDSKNINNNNNKLQSSVESKSTSFMDIFSTPITNTPSTTTSTTVPSKSDKKTKSIPSKYEEIQSVLSLMKPEPPPPMLSPLKSSNDEPIPKPEKQSFLSHSSSSQTHVKNNTNLSSVSDIKQFPNSKISPKSRNPILHKNSTAVSMKNVHNFKDKELIESIQTIKVEENVISIPNKSIETNNNNNNSNPNNSETFGSLNVKSENTEKSSKASDVPSVPSLSKSQMNTNSVFEVKPNTEAPIDSKPSLHLSPNPQMIMNNKNVVSDSVVTKVQVLDSKETKEEKHRKKDAHKDKRHKDKRKHKHKDKDREKHKRKDKDRGRDRDRDRDRHREKGNEPKDDPAFKISWSSPKHKSDVLNTAPLKLKILRKVSADEPDNDPLAPQNPLKLRIQLKDQKLASNPTETESNDSSCSRKRKSSPKWTKSEKISKHESNSRHKDDKNSNKTSSKSKKSNDDNNCISDDKRSKAMNCSVNSIGQQMASFGQSTNIGQLPTQRLSKVHK